MRWLVALLLAGGLQVARGETCLGQPQLAGLVFGTSFATLLVASTVALLLWCCTRSRSTEESIIVLEKAPDKVAYDNDALDVNLKANETFRAAKVDRGTCCNSTTRPSLDRHDSPQTRCNQRSHSAESLNNLKEMVASMLDDSDVGALGFGIYENADGIFIHHILNGGPAERSGNVFAGDKIKSLSVCFEGMVLEDAAKLLGCASPYKVKLELERSVVSEGDHADEKAQQPGLANETNAEETRRAAHRPLFRSSSLGSLPSGEPLVERKRGGSWMSKQKYVLMRRHWPPRPPSPARTNSLQDTLPDLSSPTSSFATDSSSTLPLSSLCEKSPSPPCPPLVPCTPIPTEEPQNADFVQVSSRYTFAKPSLIPRRVKKVEFCDRIEPKRQSVVVEFKENEECEGEERSDEQQSQRGANLPPQIEISRIEKIEKKESPLIIVRKLPPLPKMIEIPQKNERSGAPLYTEQKSALRKTFVPQLRANGGAATVLARERKERLDANRSLLQRQQDELRALGVLP